MELNEGGLKKGVTSEITPLLFSDITKKKISLRFIKVSFKESPFIFLLLIYYV